MVEGIISSLDDMEARMGVFDSKASLTHCLREGMITKLTVICSRLTGLHVQVEALEAVKEKTLI